MTCGKHTPGPELLRLAEEIVNSEPVISTYASCEWDELHDDGKLWIAAIVLEAQARAGTPELLAFVEHEARCDPVFAKGDGKQRIADARALVAKIRGEGSA